MASAENTMAENLQKITGKTLDKWKQIALANGFQKHGEMMNFLKEQHGMWHVRQDGPTRTGTYCHD